MKQGLLYGVKEDLLADKLQGIQSAEADQTKSNLGRKAHSSQTR